MRRILAPALATAALAGAGVLAGGVGIASSATPVGQPSAHELALAKRLAAVTRQLKAAHKTIGIQRRAIGSRNTRIAGLQGQITGLQAMAGAVDLPNAIAAMSPGAAFALLPLLVPRIQAGAPAYAATVTPGTIITFTFSFNGQQGDAPLLAQ